MAGVSEASSSSDTNNPKTTTTKGAKKGSSIGDEAATTSPTGSGSGVSVVSRDSVSNNSSSGGPVKWLYPGASDSNMASDQSVVGSEPRNGSEEAEEDPTSMQAKTSSSEEDETTGGPDTDVASVDELPVDGDGEGGDEGSSKKRVDELSQKMSAGANYLGSMFSTAWTRTAKTANDATNNSSSFLTSALTKVSGKPASDPAATHTSSSSPNGGDGSATTNAADKNGTNGDNSSDAENNEERSSSSTTTNPEAGTAAADAANPINAAAMSSFFTSALNSTFGFASAPAETKPEDGDASSETAKVSPEETNGSEGAAPSDSAAAGYGFTMEGLNSAFNLVGKAAADATSVLKDKVGAPSIISEFNKEQEEFIKSKGNAHTDAGVAPWVGYEEEDELRAKILSLSEDKRTFIRAPPSGVSFEFEYASFLPTALALIKEDERIEKMRYDLVPKRVKEQEFWRNYFYRVSLIKQSFELKDMAASQSSVPVAPSASSRVSAAEVEEQQEILATEDDEFVSDSYQASTSDMAEAAESIKKLGVGDTDDLEAELEGELNEFEVVSSKNGSGAAEEENPEWESQIQEMLDAEDAEQK